MEGSRLIAVSLELAFASTLMALVVGLPVAYWTMNRRGGIVRALSLLLCFPVAVSPTILALGLLKLLGGGSPIGLRVEALGRILSSWPATAILGAAVALPLVYQATKRALAQIDPNLIASMRVLGFSGISLFSKILLPLAWPGILAGIAFSFVRVLGEFAAGILMIGYVPGNSESGVTAITGEIALTCLFIALALLVDRLPARK